MSHASSRAKAHIKKRFEPSVRHDQPRPAPGDLEILRAFLNSKERGDSKPEELSSPEDLASWLAISGLAPEGASFTADDLLRTVRLRWAFRSLVVSKGKKRDMGEEEEESAREVGILRQVSEDIPFRLMFEDGLAPRYEPSGTAIQQALGRLIQLFAEARREGRWRRFKVCGHCWEIFYDHTPNRSGRWCRTRCGEYVRKKKSRQRLRHWRT